MRGITWSRHQRPTPVPNPAWQALEPVAQQEAVQAFLHEAGLGVRIRVTNVEHGARVTVAAHPSITGAHLLALERTLKALLDPTLYLEKTEQPDKNQLRLRGVEAL